MSTTPPTDELLATQIQNGDVEVFGELVNRYEAKMQRYARRFLSRPDEVDDLVQDVFIKVYENIQSFNPSMRFSPWIYRVAHNIFVNELKRKSRYGLASFDPDVIFSILPAKETADERALGLERSVEMEAALNQLSQKYREVLILHYYEELSYQEISDILQIPVTTVGVRINRARNKLKDHYVDNA